MRILLGIRVQMMMPVFCSPPQHAFLAAALRDERKDELKYPACRIGPVREVAMIPAGDPEHAQPVQCDANRNRRPGDAGPYRGNATCVDCQERDEIRSRHEALQADFAASKEFSEREKTAAEQLLEQATMEKEALAILQFDVRQGLKGTLKQEFMSAIEGIGGVGATADLFVTVIRAKRTKRRG